MKTTPATLDPENESIPKREQTMHHTSLNRPAVSIVFKTTGFDPQEDVPVIIALHRFDVNKTLGIDENVLKIIVHPGDVKFKPEARAAFGLDHRAVRDILVDGIDQKEAQKMVMEFIGDAPLVGHGLQRVEDFFPYLTKNRLCIDSARLCKHVWKVGSELGGFKLETHKVYELCYWLGLNQDMGNADPTTAEAESVVTGTVSTAAINVCKLQWGMQTWEQVAQKAQSFIPIETFPFGRLKGVPIAQMQEQELYRELENPKVVQDKDLLHALQEDVQRRQMDKKAQAAKKSFFARGKLSC